MTLLVIRTAKLTVCLPNRTTTSGAWDRLHKNDNISVALSLTHLGLTNCVVYSISYNECSIYINTARRNTHTHTHTHINNPKYKHTHKFVKVMRKHIQKFVSSKCESSKKKGKNVDLFHNKTKSVT